MNKDLRLGVALAVLVAGAWGALALRPQLADRQDALDARDTAQQTLDKDRAEAATLPSEQARAVSLQQQRSALDATLPDREALSRVLAELRDLASSEHVAVNTVSRSASTAPLPGLSAVSLTLDASSSYPDLQRFLEDLRGSARAITTLGAVISTGSEGGLKTNLHLVTYARNLAAAAPQGTPSMPGSVPATPSTPSATGAP